MAKIRLQHTSLNKIQSQINKMQSETENAQKKVVSAIGGLDFEVSSKHNIRSSLNKINQNLNRQSTLANEYRNAFVNVTNTLAETDNKFGNDSASIFDKIKTYVEGLVSDVKNFFVKNKLAKIAAVSSLFLVASGVASWVVTVETLKRIAEWVKNIFNTSGSSNDSTNEPIVQPTPQPEPEPAPASKLTPEQQAMVDRLNNCTTPQMSEKKRKTIVKMAETLLGEGYEPAFVAGILGNIYHEGDAGKFESSAYSPERKPKYLAYLDEHYDYRNKYSGQNIEGKSLSELYNMVNELERDGKFMSGLGCVQWSGARTKTLIETYIEVAAPNDTITSEQIYQAEALMISKELKGKYNYVYQNWKNNNSGDMSSVNAANSAGSIVCAKYEVPAGWQEKSVTRGNTAQSIYSAMLG